jgi:outer membrane protein
LQSARAALAVNREELPLARAKLLPQVSASLTGSRQNTDFGGGFPASYGNSNAYAISLTQPLIHVDSWHGCAQGRCARRARQPRDRTIAESIERSGCDRRPCRHFAARTTIASDNRVTIRQQPRASKLTPPPSLRCFTHRPRKLRMVS